MGASDQLQSEVPVHDGVVFVGDYEERVVRVVEVTSPGPVW